MNFLKNTWYVAALSTDVIHEPSAVKIHGLQILLYRTDENEVIGMSDRCPHKFAPLSMGKVKNNCIECPYHGLQFDTSGKCVYNPHGDGKIPSTAKVKSYAIHESDGIVWIWMGEKSEADISAVLKLTKFFRNGRSLMITGYIDMAVPVDLIMDNLMDLTHAPYIHSTTIATEGDAEKLKYTLKQEENTIWAYHRVADTVPTPLFAPVYQGDRCDLHADMCWTLPSNLMLDVGITNVGGEIEDGPYLHFAHLLTPIDETHTRYFYLVARNFAEQDEKVSEILAASVLAAFQEEDEPIIEAIHEYMDGEEMFSLKPVMLQTDAAGVRVRRTLNALIDKEQTTE